MYKDLCRHPYKELCMNPDEHRLCHVIGQICPCPTMPRAANKDGSALWDRCLTSTEIKQLYEAGKGTMAT